MPQQFVPASAQEQNLLGRRQSVRAPARSSTRGPCWRALRLCVLAVLTPCLLVAGPLYLRYRVYHATMYPLAMSDMRMINAHVSTTWCQSQVVQANTTYNAYVVSGAPGVLMKPQRVSMSRQLELEDDMKEYWAFYLLRDSVVTVSTCVRWDGASLIIIKGHKHLRECAYIGDDSSEEADEIAEVLEARRVEETDVSNKTNTPDMMRRFRPGVVFHVPQEKLSPGEQLTAGSSSDASDQDTILASVLLRKATEAARMRNNRRAHPAAAAGTLSPPTSGEVFDEMLKKIQDLGPRGKNVLQKLNRQIGLTEDHDGLTTDATAEVRRRRRGLEGPPARKPREISLKTPSLRDALNTHDAAEDAAIEEDLQPDGIADHHRVLNQTTVGDRSNSEFWSSFSSSEEALLQCAGLVLNLPLHPDDSCEVGGAPANHLQAAQLNTITYKVPSNGYYFFVFSSENEIKPNYVSVQFELEKTVYDVSRPVAECRNVTGSCSLPLGFWSHDTVVVELPVDANTSMWSDEEFFASSECKPRTAVYLACIIAVPLLIVGFAFH